MIPGRARHSQMMELSSFEPVFRREGSAASCWGLTGAPCEDIAHHFRDDERHGRADHAEESAAGDTHE